jgi:hypothetical protein
VEEDSVDAGNFDTFAKALVGSGSRRRTLGGLLAGALALVGGLQSEEVVAKKCNQKDKKKRKQCKKQAQENENFIDCSLVSGTGFCLKGSEVCCPASTGGGCCEAIAPVCCFDEFGPLCCLFQSAEVSEESGGIAPYRRRIPASV